MLAAGSSSTMKPVSAGVLSPVVSGLTATTGAVRSYVMVKVSSVTLPLPSSNETVISADPSKPSGASSETTVSNISTDWSRGGLIGRSFASVGRAMIAWYTSHPDSICPKIVCTPSSQGVATSVMKNWLSCVSGPELAIATTPGSEKSSEGSNSSAKGPSRLPPVPSPNSASPVWNMKSSMTR